MRREDNEGWSRRGDGVRCGRAATRAVTILLIFGFLALMALLAWRIALMRSEAGRSVQAAPVVDDRAAENGA